MQFDQWFRDVFPKLPAETKAAIRAEVKALKAEGWSPRDAWIQVACTC